MCLFTSFESPIIKRGTSCYKSWTKKGKTFIRGILDFTVNVIYFKLYCQDYKTSLMFVYTKIVFIET